MPSPLFVKESFFFFEKGKKKKGREMMLHLSSAPLMKFIAFEILSFFVVVIYAWVKPGRSIVLIVFSLLLLLNGVLHLLPTISMFCALPQNDQHLLEK